MKFSFTFDDAIGQRLVDRFGAARVLPALTGALFREGERVMAAAKELVPVDLGVLRDSGYVDVANDGSQIMATVGFGGAAFPYAIYVHEGTGPAVGEPAFSPPGGAGSLIAEWAARHGMADARGAAWALAQAIGQRGLTPRKFLERAFVAARDGMSERIAADIEQQILGSGVGGGRKISVDEFQPIAPIRGRPAPPPPRGRAPRPQRASIDLFKPIGKPRKKK